MRTPYILMFCRNFAETAHQKNVASRNLKVFHGLYHLLPEIPGNATQFLQDENYLSMIDQQGKKLSWAFPVTHGQVPPFFSAEPQFQQC